MTLIKAIPGFWHKDESRNISFEFFRHVPTDCHNIPKLRQGINNEFFLHMLLG